MWKLAVLDADDVPDNVSFRRWLGGGGCWRLRTYAIYDQHTFLQDWQKSFSCAPARPNKQSKVLGDIIKAHHVIHFAESRRHRPEAACSTWMHRFVPKLGISSGPSAFWKPDDAVIFDESVT